MSRVLLTGSAGHDQEDKLNQVLLEAKSLLERSVSVTNFESESEAEIERKTTEGLLSVPGLVPSGTC